MPSKKFNFTAFSIGKNKKGKYMRTILSIKMLFWSPIKTIVTLLLLTAITFMLLSRVYE